MKVRFSVIAGVVALVATACVLPGPDVARELDLTEFEIPNGTACFYLTDFVAVSKAGEFDATTELEVDPTAAADVLAETTSESEPSIPNDVMEAVSSEIGEMVVFYRVGQDPLQVSMYLREVVGVDAAPINLLGVANHIKMQPGTDPVVVTGYELPNVDGTPLDGGRVAVVDSGIAEQQSDNPVPSWLYGADAGGEKFVLYDDVDEETLEPSTNPASHGTFIAGLIRQIAPGKQVTFAAARLVNPDAVTLQGDDELPPGPATAEIQVAEAIARLMVRHPGGSNENMIALNLSLGSYTCDPNQDKDMVTITTMTNDWLDTYPGSVVLAAAGNENYKAPDVAGLPAFVPFYPAALAKGSNGVIHAVAAVDQQATEIVWVDQAPVRLAPNDRPWVTDWAPGADLIGLSGAADNDVPQLVCWSGSSFATAIATAQLANGLSPSNARYDADGVQYVENGCAPTGTTTTAP